MLRESANRQRSSRVATRGLLLLLAILCMTPTGCIRRRLTVRSNPPGATVQLDNQPIGVTPASTDYVYYGTREVKLSMPGYETLTVNQPLPTPWYAWPGVDFLTENLWPFTIEDKREVSFNLARQRMAPANEIIGRGEQLRRQAAPQGVAPIGAAAGVPLNSPFGSSPLFSAPAPSVGLPAAPGYSGPATAPGTFGAAPTGPPALAPSAAPLTPLFTPPPATNPAPPPGAFRY
ncbi:PEGA domain-containing protein [Botrimarina hoheduenensis]|uniref:PEGA domain protein n=1 Tax=Botrimarina hoheduenensis TaxID=2528000 RepID=A0A5C5WCF2_9BACT|nr:PEGA domain-containing protein [Botrimarina hoheduenensis]TWT48344.1 PEGA domain protein [Botrimarina hoheduenensis]